MPWGRKKKINKRKYNLFHFFFFSLRSYFSIIPMFIYFFPFHSYPIFFSFRQVVVDFLFLGRTRIEKSDRSSLAQKNLGYRLSGNCIARSGIFHSILQSGRIVSSNCFSRVKRLFFFCFFLSLVLLLSFINNDVESRIVFVSRFSLGE